MAKYKLTKNTKEVYGKTLFQIEATVSFGLVAKGELGGWIEQEENLSQEGNAWVSGDARVYGDAWVSGDARVYGNAEVYGDARVYGNAEVYGDAWVYGNAEVYGKLRLSLGHFFGWREKDEELTFLDIDDNYQLIGKGACKTEEEEKETIKIGDVEFDKEEVEKRLKGLKPLE